MMIEVGGIIPALVTPFNDDESLNLPVLKDLVDYLIEKGVHGLFAVGTQGEAYAMTYEEKRAVFETVVEQGAGRVPVYAGTGAITTREAVLLAKAAQQAGVDAISVITPYFVSPDEDELRSHYTSIAEAVDVPVLLYNNPSRTGINLSADLVSCLSRIENIVGIKDSGGDLTLTGEFIRRCSADFAVLAGRDTLIYATLAMGGRGAIAATANLAPQLVVEIYEAHARGDYEAARDAQRRLAVLRNAFSLGTFPVVVKEALDLLGFPVGAARRPIMPMSSENRDRLRQLLAEIKLLS